MVSVPCVTTMPSASSAAKSALTRAASFSQRASSMSWLPICAICSPLTAPRVRTLGTALISASTARSPGL
jgi:hypothetical protein